MKKKYSDPCVRCGAERVVSETWKEIVDGSEIVNTLSVCPNPECQKKVDLSIDKLREKRRLVTVMSKERVARRKAIKPVSQK